MVQLGASQALMRCSLLTWVDGGWRQGVAESGRALCPVKEQPLVSLSPIAGDAADLGVMARVLGLCSCPVG